jgi:hypothetical protein
MRALALSVPSLRLVLLLARDLPHRGALKRATRPQLWHYCMGRKRNIGRCASEEDAARAYDCAAVQAHGPGAGRNLPGEAISEPPASLGEKRKRRSRSRYIGVESE